MKVSVVIPTYNAGPLFDEVLGRVFEQETDFPYDVLCIDSGSRDETVEIAKRHGARVTTIEPGTFNHGLTRNRGIEACDGDLVALLVQDATPADGKWLASLAKGFERADDVAGTYARQVPRPHCNPFMKDRLEKWVSSRLEPVVQRVASPEEFEALAPIERLQRIGFDDVSSMLRRDVWQKYPYRERNFGEDIDWSKRILLEGYAIAYEPEATVIHSHDNSVLYEFRRLYCDHQNLRDLVGLQLVNKPFDVVRQGVHGLGHYTKVLGRSDEPWLRKARFFFHMLPLPFAENLGQYMGSHSRKWMTKHGWFSGIDRRLKRGI